MTVITETFRRLDKTAPAKADVGFVYFTVNERRYDGAGDFVVVQVRVPCRLNDGVLTSPDLVAGPALVPSRPRVDEDSKHRTGVRIFGYAQL